jgi:hypothetical protein
MLPDDLSIACVNYNMPFSTAQLTDALTLVVTLGSLTQTGVVCTGQGTLH